MPNHKSTIKRVRTNQRDGLRNQHYKSLMRTQLKRVLSESERGAAEIEYRRATSILDRLVSKGIIHRNQAANKKARLARHVNGL